MGRPTLADSKDTKAELTQVALEMIQTRGYNAFSYQDLADRLEIRKASIHYHFPTKEDLGVYLIKNVSERFQTWKETQAALNLDPVAKLQAYFDYFGRIIASGTKVCPCGSLAAEWASLPKKLQEETGRHMNNHKSWLKATLEEGRKAGVFVNRGSVDEQAQFIYGTVQGVMQTLRAQGVVEQFEMVTKQLMGSIKA